MLSARRRCLATCAALADAASLQRGSPALTSGSPAPDHAGQHPGRSLAMLHASTPALWLLATRRETVPSPQRSWRWALPRPCLAVLYRSVALWSHETTPTPFRGIPGRVFECRWHNTSPDDRRGAGLVGYASSSRR